jgi:DNA-directed RNA polymerase specialized sigma24 family protein
LAADDDPELGFLGVLSLRDVADVCEEHQVRKARESGWTWAQIAAALGVSSQAVHQRYAERLATCNSSPSRGDLSR